MHETLSCRYLQRTALQQFGCGLVVALSLLFIGLSTGTRASAATASVAVHFDYPLLQQLLVKQLFSTPDSSREIINDPDGCSRIFLSEPYIGPEGDTLNITAAVKAEIGVEAFGSCRQVLNWRGNVRFLGQPLVQPGGRSLRLQARNVWLIDSDGNKIFSGPLWDASINKLRTFFGDFVLNLAPYIDPLSEFLPEVLPQRSLEQLQAIIASLAFSDIQVTATSLDATIKFDIEEQTRITEQGADLAQAAELTAEELEQFERRWQMMDALLAGAVKQYASATELLPLRSTLLDILLDSRYRLLEVLSQPTNQSDDKVRHWFIESWQQLSPVVRRIALEQDEQQDLLWLTVLTATDALYTLDQLGPSIGMEISSNGLRRLARMLNAQHWQELLHYSEDIDPQLLRMWQQREIPQAEQGEEQGDELPAGVPSAWRLNFSIFPRAHALVPMRDLNLWVPDLNELPVYLPAVAEVLENTSAKVVQQQTLLKSQRLLYGKLVLATAWQESCWRQYMVENQRIVPLRSGSGDIGLMQVNEYVWRGLYDLQKLRWDIEYNINAGSEILLNYMVKYALKKNEHERPGGFNNLARASYSAYNGGPGQVSRYRRSNVSPEYRKTDTLFWEKYQQVDAGNHLNVATCFGIDAISLRNSAASANSSKETETIATTPTSERTMRWLRIQPDNNYTLQLATFSEHDSAARFIVQQSIPASAYIHAMRHDRTVRYVVIHGSYSSRAAAEPARQKYKKLQPWLRQFRELR